MESCELLFVFNSLNAWQTNKHKEAFISDALSEVRQFEITLPDIDSSATAIHFYIGLDKYPFLNGDESHATRLYMHAICDSYDQVDVVKSQWMNMPNLISSGLASNVEPIIDTSLPSHDTPNEITPTEAEHRVQLWSHISEWAQYSCMFDVFKVPIEDFDITDTSCSYTGFFAMKDTLQGNLEPDLVIQKTSDSGEVAYMDSVRSAPPYRNLEEKNSFGLLNF